LFKRFRPRTGATASQNIVSVTNSFIVKRTAQTASELPWHVELLEI